MALLGTGLAFVPANPSAAVGLASAQDDPGIVAQMKKDADGTVDVSTRTATGAVGFIGARTQGTDLYPEAQADDRASAVAKATAYLDDFGAAFGAAKGQLEQTRVTASDLGWTVTYVQEYDGLPVYGSGLKVNVDADGALTSVAGYAAPDLDLDTTPAFGAGKAADRAVALVKSAPPTVQDGTDAGTEADTTGVKAVSNELQVYRVGALAGEDTDDTRLVHVVEVSNGTNVRDLVFIDAATGKPVNRFSLVEGAGTDRELYEANPDGEGYPDAELVWSEGDPLPGDLNEDQENLVRSAGESYWLYQNAFGRDSYDGEGATMRTVNNDPTIACPNANWNGTTTNYCDGVTSDDVVSHEWGHAYTEYTSGLIYQYQPGALNESYSDVWGETVDLINGREDEGESFETVREVGDCDVTAPDSLEVSITAPESAAGACYGVAAGFGPSFDTTPITPTVVVGTDSADSGSTLDGCATLTNTDAIDGNYVYVDRGVCSFQQKAENALAAGAAGLVVGNNNVDLPLSMSGEADIPALMITQADGARVKQAGSVTMSIAAEDTTNRDDTTRWLVGEKSTAFGGAIRDMWTPTCYGDPGKVTDAEYKCDPTFGDSGGVHSNSGVPNHAYALLVDGGTYNGQTVGAIGLDKAANIWWRAQSAYLVPSSNFVDAADAFEQSCTDLVGASINELTTEADATPVVADPITSSDCSQVGAAMTAVEMRTEPVRCDFQPLLAKDAPSLCGEGFTTETVWSEDFEDGLDGWEASQTLELPPYGQVGGFGMPWEPVTEAPGDHDSAVAFGPTPDAGDCLFGANDFSSADFITGPEVTMPSGTADANPRLSFDHYVATEAIYDGGNVQLSINGGDFTAVPAGAYLYNAPTRLDAYDPANGEYSTNPLGGQPGFTGTDGGEVKGSWGTSIIDLEALELSAGDTVAVRLAIGRDGCGGIDGWYVDDVAITLCKVTSDLVAAHRPDPSRFGKPSRVVFGVADSVQGAPAPTGTVVLRRGSTVFGEVELTGGTGVLALPATVPAGDYALRLIYSGDDAFTRDATTLRFTIAPAKSTTRVVRKGQAAPGRRPVVRVKVSSPTVDQLPGRVVVLDKKSKKVVGSSTLSKRGVAGLRLRTNRTGKHAFVARYVGGGSNIERSQQVFRLRLR
ncbi:MAG: hypothetical protein CMH83_06110 [Nocardioides sp.]|nr:hypothetical protein [Nocardioides sp.]